MGSAGARELLSEARNENTRRKYERRLNKWFEFCEIGHRGKPYDPDSWSIAKWWLFAGWMLDPKNNKDKDLNTVRSALNQYFEDSGGTRVVLGHTVRTIIAKFRMRMEQSKRDRGEPVGLNREPCDASAFEAVLNVASHSTGLRLKQSCCQMLQLLGWFRADTMRGFQPGDVYWTPDGWLNILVRQVKMQPERRLFPAHLRVPPGDTEQHVRTRLFAAFRRADRLVPGWYTYVSARLEGITRTDGQAASMMTDELRELVGSSVPRQLLLRISSHSWREMAAVSTSRSGGCLFKMITRGLWKRVETMISNYIEPFGHFPFVQVLADLFDDLQPGGRFENGVNVRADGRGPTASRGTGRVAH